uniref:t-SNARE coiled-coil homology domain-containing protein n=1 Tax=Syphacia muris TaxID=451379 RepID=A0A0N5AIB8_9BILA
MFGRNGLETLTTEKPSTSTLDPYGSNHSVDRVVSQIERISGRINDLVLNSKKQIDGMIEHGADTLSQFSKHFEVGKEGIEELSTALDKKFGGFPINALLVLLITSLIVLIMFLIYMMTAGSEQLSSGYRKLMLKRKLKKQAATERNL